MREKRRTALRRRLIMACLILILTCLCILILPFKRFVVAAEEKNPEGIRYTTYVVRSGDTLWDIADCHMTEDFDNHQSYINEVIRANGLNSSRIYDGQLIIIPQSE